MVEFIEEKSIIAKSERQVSVEILGLSVTMVRART
jgi:hypothetical protein